MGVDVSATSVQDEAAEGNLDVSVLSENRDVNVAGLRY